MTITATGHHGGDPEQYCERLVLEPADWHEATQLAELNRAMGTPAGLRQILTAAREANERADRLAGLVPA